MKAIVVQTPGDPEVMHLGEVPDPTAARGEVLVRTRATAVNRADTLQRRGLYPPPPGASEIIGMEVAGEVEALGEGVDWCHTGDRVMALLAGGGYAERVAVPAGQLMRVPDGMSWTDAAAIPEVFLTAHDNLFTRGRLAAGETVLIHGGGGGVGTAAIQLAHRGGARVLVTAGSAAKLQRCRELGADGGINHREEDFVARSRDLTDGGGVDVILDAMGASYLARNLDALAPEGRLVVIGLMGGTVTDIDLGVMLRRRLSVVATTLRGRPVEQKTEVVRRFVEDALPGFADGSLRPVVDRVLPLAEAAAAHRAMENGENVGKLVLRVD